MRTEVIVALSTLAGGLGTSIITTLPEYIRAKKEAASVKPKDTVRLEYHPIFAYLDEMEAYFLTRYVGYDPGRTALIREMVVHKIRIWRPILKAAAVELDKCVAVDKSSKKDTCNKVFNVFSASLTDGLREYVQWHKADRVLSVDGSMEYTEEDKQTMGTFIAPFQVWHSPREEMVTTGVHEISNSKVITECISRGWDILLVYQLAFLNLKIDAEKTNNELNGSLTGKRFLGITVGPCEY